MTTGIVLVVVLGLLLVLFAVLFDGGPWRVVGGIVVLLAAAPLTVAARTQPAGIGRQNVRPQLAVLGWFLVAVAVVAAGLVVYSR